MTDQSENISGSTEQVKVPAAETREEIELETENLIATYESVAEWIRFADAKAAAVLTVAGALAGVLIPTLKEYLDQPVVNDVGSAVESTITGYRTIVCIVYIVWLGFTVASCWQAFRCILPFRRKGQHPSLERCAHFHPAAISTHYAIDDHDQFVSGYQTAGVTGFRQEVLAGLLIDSHISSAKYGRVTSSIRMLGWSAFMAMVYLLATQF